MGPHSCEAGGVTIVRHDVEDGVLYKNADRSTYEGDEEVNVDVITSAVESSIYLFFDM